MLKYWCYPNVKDEDGDKKEICDLLVLFRDVCLIITVKNYEFKGNHERYFQNTTKKALKQLNGAERKLFRFPRDIHIKHPDREKEKFEKKKYKAIYRIFVNLGIESDFYDLKLENSNADNVFVFDKESFQILLNELDTLYDLTEYLEKRDTLFKGREKVIIQGTEKDLLALFLKGGKKFPPEFTKAGYTAAIIDVENQWEEFIEEEKEIRARKKEEDKVSYFIDQLTEREMNNLPQGHLLSQELLVLNRFARRTITKVFFDFYSLHENRLKLATGHRYVELEDIGFVFLYYSPDITDEVFTDNMLQTAVMGYSILTKYKMKKMYGIGTTHELNQFKFMFLEVPKPFEPNVVKEVKKMVKEFNWFQNIKQNGFTEKEYPKE